MTHFTRTTAILLLLPAMTGASPAADPPATRPADAGAPDASPQQPFKPVANNVLATVQNELHKIQSLEADFDEAIYRKNSPRPVHFYGHLAAKEPNRVIWIVYRPYRNAIRMLGEELRVWNEEMAPGQVKVINLAGNPTYKTMSQQTRDWMGGNFKVLSESYAVLEEKKTPLVLRFVPKASTGLGNVFDSVSVTLEDDLSSIKQIVYRKSTGETYVLALDKTRVNKPIEPKLWTFPPTFPAK